MITDTKQARRVLEQLRLELPKGVSKEIVRDVLDEFGVVRFAAEAVFAHLIMDHGYTFYDAHAAYEAVRKLEK